MSAWRRGARAGVAFCAALGMLGLAGCQQQSMNELHARVQQVLARKGKPIAPPPQMQPYEAFIYPAKDKADPFQPFARAEPAAAKPKSNGVHPDFNRHKEELEAFSLDSLRMVGTIREGKQIWGLVQSPDGVIHRVRVGNYMGKNYGRITRIQDSDIKLIETVPNGQGGWRHRQAALALVQ